MQQASFQNGESVLACLRGMFPDRSLRFTEALRIAELQAVRLLQVSYIETMPVPHEIVTELPRIRVESRDIPTSGLSFWDGGRWVICLNRREPRTRQRFTLLHEFKHIIDHGRTAALYHRAGQQTAEQQAERTADYFAGCVLMPRTELKRAWGHGIQRVGDLARYFNVSERAIQVRLAQVGLTDDPVRCGRAATPIPRRGSYYRSPSLDWFLTEAVPA
jgi:Zn-dependent peptidase ImmA (M78 family)